MYNMIRSSRVKKVQPQPAACTSILSNKSRAAGTSTTDELLSEVWDNEDDDKYLIIRLIHSKGYPWLVCHHGIQQVFKGPLFVPIIEAVAEGVVTLFLRDFANRGENCIKRKFYLTFGSVAEAESFKITHNILLSQYRQERCQQTNEKNSEEDATTKTKTHNDMAAAVLEQPAKKKRRISKISQGEVVPVEERNNTKVNKTMEKEGDNEDYDEYKKRFNEFERGDNCDLFYDDVPNTQNPFSDDDSI